MNPPKKVLVLHPKGRATPELQMLANTIGALGAQVRIMPCDRYDELIDEIERADTVVFWK